MEADEKKAAAQNGSGFGLGIALAYAVAIVIFFGFDLYQPRLLSWPWQVISNIVIQAIAALFVAVVMTIAYVLQPTVKAHQRVGLFNAAGCLVVFLVAGGVMIAGPDTPELIRSEHTEFQYRVFWWYSMGFHLIASLVSLVVFILAIRRTK